MEERRRSLPHKVLWSLSCPLEILFHPIPSLHPYLCTNAFMMASHPSLSSAYVTHRHTHSQPEPMILSLAPARPKTLLQGDNEFP